MSKNQTHSRKDLALWTSCIRYYKNNPKSWSILDSIVHNRQSGTTSVPSLRCIFYFITAYTKDNPLQLTHAPLTTVQDAYSHYRHMLQIHTKRRFDPFCRRNKHSVELHGKTIESNVGQLVFFRWFFDTGLYDRLLESHEKVLTTRRLQANAKRLNKDTEAIKSGPRVIVKVAGPSDIRNIRIAVRFG